MSIFQKSHHETPAHEPRSARFFTGVVLGLCGVGMVMIAFFFLSSFVKGSSQPAAKEHASEKSIRSIVNSIVKKVVPQEKSPEEKYQDALKKSANIHGIYMAAAVANDTGTVGSKLRNHLLSIATSTEINGIVIDVKEVCGPEYNAERIKELVDILHKNNIWAIARIAAMKDASQIVSHPDWYLWRASGPHIPGYCDTRKDLRAPAGDTPSAHTLWQDKKGGYWFDAANPEVRNYLADIGKKMIDIGFDELQYDYVRFPSDGDVSNAKYPTWDGKTSKYEVMKTFFASLHDNLKAYKPDVILSADLFGNVATVGQDLDIGQRLEDMGDSFDYLSFMVYPSHYYGGFVVPTDPEHQLPAVNMNLDQTRRHPDVVISRSLIVAREFMNGENPWSPPVVSQHASSTATTTSVVATPKARSKARIRPWLEDFFHESDQAVGRPYGAQKVRMQIDAAEQTENHGWLLWNAGNIYAEGALKTK